MIWRRPLKKFEKSSVEKTFNNEPGCKCPDDRSKWLHLPEDYRPSHVLSCPLSWLYTMLDEFRPIPREGERAEWLIHGGWVWYCRCGFDAYCCEDVGGHRRECPESAKGDKRK